MHTAVCTLRDHETAVRAREQLLRAGFDRHQVHLQHRGEDSDLHAGEDSRGWQGTDHEIAVDRNMVDRVAGFFVRLFGQDHPEGHDRRYGEAVEQGHYVLVVDTDDPEEARRAHLLLHDLQAEDVAVVHRPEHRPLRDLVGTPASGALAGSYADRASAFDDDRRADLVAGTPAHVESPARVQAAFKGRSTDWTDDRSESAAGEKAVAAGADTEPRLQDRRDDDLDHVGLRYADKDKPGP